jgi:hypothetical protein
LFSISLFEMTPFIIMLLGLELLNGSRVIGS